MHCTTPSLAVAADAVVELLRPRARPFRLAILAAHRGAAVRERARHEVCRFLAITEQSLFVRRHRARRALAC